MPATGPRSRPSHRPMDKASRNAVDGGRLLAQAIRVVLALVLAFLSAALFLAFGLLRAMDPGSDPVAFGATVGWSLVGASVIGGFAFVPTLIGVALSEALALRGAVFHLLAGGAIGAGIWMMTEPGRIEPAKGVPPGTLVALAAGFVAGFVYWLLAGRQAGCWRGGASGS